MGQIPTAPGISRVTLPGVTAFLWESVKGHVCLGESEFSGQLRAVKCGEGKVRPKGASQLAALFGPGMLSGKARVVMVAEPGQKVASVSYQKQKMDWKFIRTLSPSGRGVYYVTLPDFPDDWLDVTLKTGHGGGGRPHLARLVTRRQQRGCSSCTPAVSVPSYPDRRPYNCGGVIVKRALTWA